jgi:hypothetical protein
MQYIEISELNQLLDSGLEVYRHFIGEVKLGKKIKSPIRIEDDPSFSIFANRSKGLYYWKDSGSGEFGDHWDFIKRKLNCEFREAVNYSKQHILNLGNFGIDQNRINEVALMLAAKPKIKVEQERAKIIPQFRPWNQQDEDYFARRCKMTCKEMEDAWYLPVSKVEIIKPDKRYELYASAASPMYAICFPSGNFKIWRPNEHSKRKWISNVDREKDFYLLDKCKGGDVLLILAGNRDCAAIRKHLKIDSFALLSETADLPFEIFQQLHIYYKKIFLLYDNDTAGYKGARKQEIAYGIPFLNDLYKPFKVNDFCELIEDKFELLDQFSLSLYAEL